MYGKKCDRSVNFFSSRNVNVYEIKRIMRKFVVTSTTKKRKNVLLYVCQSGSVWNRMALYISKEPSCCKLRTVGISNPVM